MKTLGTIDRYILKTEEIVSKILLGSIIVLVFAAAALRLLRMPLVWSVDLAQLLFVWVCFIGADFAMGKDKHIGVDLLTNHLSQKMQKSTKFISYLLAIAFLCLIAVYGTRLAIINVKDQFSGMELSHSWATASAPVGCVLMIRTLVKKSIGLAFGGAVTVKEAS
ncbi:MAG: TRAP transporter small permease [Spirochaetes bacterium]|nr:TRAP transporter small permease [Spirochaetota bacterium]